MYDAIVVGAGIAGIAVALRLRKQGKSVLVLDKNNYVGGKIYHDQSMGYRWDMGPSLFTLPNLVDELYLLFDKNPRDYYDYSQQSESCRYFWEDKTNVIFHTDFQKLQEEVSEKLGANPQDLKRYLDKSAQKYNSIGTIFLENPIHLFQKLPWWEIFKKIPQILQTEIFTSLHRVNKKALKSDKLVQVFDRYGTYSGSNPYRASGILSMVPHLEQNIGTFFPKKGMRSIVEGLFSLAKEVGIEFRLGENIKDCTKSKDSDNYIVTTTETYTCKYLVSAIDHLNFYKDILKNNHLFKKYETQERSSSAVIFYWGINKKFEELGLHNIFFSNDYQQEFEIIFNNKKIPLKGTIYVHISSKSNPEDAPEGAENWFVMLNVPAGAVLIQNTVEQIRTSILSRLSNILNTDIEPYIQTEKMWTPSGIALDTGAYEGALYGAASNTKTAPLSRHPNHSTHYKNLYFCGGTVHPGGGIPLALQSAKIVDNLIRNA